jgi:misacylated tRNA(Ala) deacylase
MSRCFCHDYPDILSLETRVIDTRPGAVVVERSPFHPGGGGQLPDRGRLTWQSGEARVDGFEIAPDGRVWHLLAEPVEVAGVVQTSVDPAFRALQTELHTNAHVLNALVFQHFQGALITGAQLNDDGTARTDFDLPDVDNNRLRALEPALNDVIRQDLPLRVSWVSPDALTGEPGLIRCRSVAPPPAADGSVRVVEIVGLDRQACGGTHLASTGRSRAVRILKIDNKGRHNRRVKIGLVD